MDRGSWRGNWCSNGLPFFEWPQGSSWKKKRHQLWLPAGWTKFHIRTGNDVSIGPEAAILTLGHDPQSRDFADRGGDVVIGNRAWIGYRAIILPGIKIGEGAVVGAGAVVTKDVDAFAIVAGNPARKIGERNRDLSYQPKFHPFLI